MDQSVKASSRAQVTITTPFTSYYNYFRDYDPRIGRYIQSDPIGLEGGWSTFAYVGSSPARNYDEFGLLFGFNAGESLGADAAQYWADRQVQTGNDLYAVPGLLASLWTPCTSNSTFLNLVAPTAVGKGLPKLAKLLPNGAKGAIGETLSLASNWLKGNKYLGRQVTPRGTTTIADSAWQSRSGAEYFVESKFGTAGLTKAQRAASKILGDAYKVEKWTYDWIERNIGKPLGTALGGLGLLSDCTCEGGK